jgi:molybdopterin molybdotransferase
MPPWDNSAMDGFAVQAADTAGASEENPVKLPLMGDRFAGDAPARDLKAEPGKAIRIMTGAPIPRGFDAVVIRENTSAARDWDENATDADFFKAAQKGDNIRRAGEDVHKGELVGSAGDLLTPGRINLLAAAGQVALSVHRRPTVAILASGDELCEVGTPLFPGAIINSNAHAVAAGIRAVGGVVHLAGIARDSLDDHCAHVAATSSFDLLITIGGVSAGAKDHVRPALDAEGMETIFFKVAQKPGKPLLFGRRGRQMVIGLPGNPVSALVGLHLYVAPLLRRLQGLHDARPRPVSATWRGTQSESKRRDLTYFARGVLSLGQAGMEFTPNKKQGSGQISGIAKANALALYPAGVDTIEPDQSVEVLLLNDGPLLSP